MNHCAKYKFRNPAEACICYISHMIQTEQYHELAFYTLAHTGESFIHQHIVDAFAAQTADYNSKPITTFFALAGLYVFLEKNYTGLEVRDAHLHMAKETKRFPTITLPEDRGAITVSDVLAAPAGGDRDEMIRLWCISVWDAFSEKHRDIIALTEKLLNAG